MASERLVNTSPKKVMPDRVTNTWPSAAAWAPAGWLTVGALALCLGLLASKGYGPLLIVAVLLCGAFVWAARKAEALPAIMLGVAILPTAAMSATRFHGIPVTTALGAATLCAALALWWQRRAQVPNLCLSAYSLAGLLLLIVAAIAQLGLSPYAQASPIYQLATFWLAGLLLGSLVASDLRMADRVALLALPLAALAITESILRKPNLWSDLVGANGYDSISTSGGIVRASSTFGHPLVAGTALVIMAFLIYARPGRTRAILFSLTIAGALATVSRTAIVGLAAGLAIYFAGNYRQRLRVIGVVALTLGIGGLVLTAIPALNASFGSRVLNSNVQGQGIRLNSLYSLGESFSNGDPVLITGRGIGGSIRYLAETGGNLGFRVYDNQYVTSIYDSGLLVLFVVVGLIVVALSRARPSARILAPLGASATTMFFFEGLYWPITGLLFWMTVGLATAPRTVVAKTRAVR
jgi:hypothetical protein